MKERPWIIVLLLLALVPAGMPIRIFGRTPNVSLFDVLLIAVWLWLVVQALLGKPVFVRDKTINWLVMCCLLANLASFLFSLRDPQRSALAIKVILLGYGAYVVTRAYVRSVRGVRIVCCGLILFGLCLSSLLVYGYAVAGELNKSEVVAGIHIGTYIAAMLLPVVAYVLMRLFSSTVKRAVFWAVPALILVIALAITFSRGGMLTIAAVFPVGLFMLRKVLSVSRLLVISALLFVAFAYALPTDLLLKNQEFFADKAERGDPARLRIWSISLHQFADHPFLGVGPGCIYIFNNQNLYKELHSHNYVLNSLADTGLLGAIPYLLAFGVVARRAYRVTTQSKDRQQKILYAGLFAALLSMLVHGLVEPTFVGQECMALFWIIAALLPCGSSSHCR